MRVLIPLLFLLFYSFSSLAQQSKSEKELKDIEKNLQERISILNDSLIIIQKKLRHLENQKYLEQFNNQTGFSLEGVLQIEGKLREGSTPESPIITIIKAGESINLTDYKNSYWIVNQGPHYGYINELYIKETEPIKRFKEELKLRNEKMKIEYEKKEAAKQELEKLKLKEEKQELAKQEKIKEEKYRQSLISKFGKEIGQKLFEGYYWIGMTREMARISLGKPTTINKSVGSWGVHEQWVYYSTYLYFKNDILSSFQNSNR